METCKRSVISTGPGTWFRQDRVKTAEFQAKIACSWDLHLLLSTGSPLGEKVNKSGAHNEKANTWEQQSGRFGSRVRLQGAEPRIRSGDRSAGGDQGDPRGSRARRHVFRY